MQSSGHETPREVQFSRKAAGYELTVANGQCKCQFGTANVSKSFGKEKYAKGIQRD